MSHRDVTAAEKPHWGKAKFYGPTGARRFDEKRRKPHRGETVEYNLRREVLKN